MDKSMRGLRHIVRLERKNSEGGLLLPNSVYPATFRERFLLREDRKGREPWQILNQKLWS